MIRLRLGSFFVLTQWVLVLFFVSQTSYGMLKAGGASIGEKTPERKVGSSSSAGLIAEGGAIHGGGSAGASVFLTPDRSGKNPYCTGPVESPHNPLKRSPVSVRLSRHSLMNDALGLDLNELFKGLSPRTVELDPALTSGSFSSEELMAMGGASELGTSPLTTPRESISGSPFAGVDSYLDRLGLILSFSPSELEARTLKIGSGAGSEVFLVYRPIPEDLAVVYSHVSRRQLLGMFPTLRVEDARRQLWIQENSEFVIKLRKFDASCEFPPEALLVRDLRLMDLLAVLSSQFKFEVSPGVFEPIVTVAHYVQSSEELRQGVLKQEPVFGLEAFEIAKLLREAESDATIETRLRNLGFEGVVDAQRKVTALQRFYAENHAGVMEMLRKEGLPIVKNLTRDGSLAEVGFDYNRGRNVIWDPRARIFKVIDP